MNTIEEHFEHVIKLARNNIPRGDTVLEKIKENNSKAAVDFVTAYYLVNVKGKYNV